MDLDDVRLFTKVAELGSFTQAARALDVPKSTVSRRIAELEQRLDVRLLQRTTRKLKLTEAGRLYFDRTSRAIEDLEQAELSLAAMRNEPRGGLRLTVPSDMNGLVPRLLSDFRERYPLVDLFVLSTGRRVDLVAEGYDVALRASPRLPDSSMLAKKLIDSHLGVFASPQYLARRGRPESPEQLAHHECLIFGPESLDNEWQLRAPGQEAFVKVQVTGRFASNDFTLLMGACLLGFGIGFLPAFEPARLVKQGRLERLFPDHESPLGALYAVYPSRRHLSPNVRAFVDFAERWFVSHQGLWAGGEAEDVGEPVRFLL